MKLKDLGLKNVCSVYHIDLEQECNVEWISARDLVKPERLDLIAKIIYIDYYINNYQGDFAKGNYKRDLEVCTCGTFNEEGDEDKNSFNDYCKIFEKLIDSIRANGFRDDRPIPVGNNGIIIDGAHRTAIGAYYNLDVPIVRINIEEPLMGAALYKKRLAPQEHIDFAITEMCKWSEDLFLCCMWPAADEVKRNKAIEILENRSTIIYSKKIDLNVNGLSNLIPQIYMSHEWVGSINNRFISAAPKIEGVCGKGKLEIFLFRGSSLEIVKEIKSEMRNVFGIAENSLHITDYPHETLFISQMLFNNTTVLFLNKAIPFYFIELNKRLYRFKKALLEKKLDCDKYIIDSATIMGLYGIREPNDLDYLGLGNECVVFDNDINDHQEELVFYNQSKADLIFNPANHFYYNGIKFVSLEILLAFKKKRNTLKDREDVFMIMEFIENKSTFRRDLILIQQKIRRKIRNIIYSTLRKLPGDGYTHIRDLYHLINKRKI